MRRSRAGHLYFELVEKGEGDDVVAKLDAVSWRREAASMVRQLADMGQELTDGIEVRCRVEVDFYPPFGRLQVIVREIDSVFVLGRLSRRRQEVIEALVRKDLFDRNRELALPAVPLRLGLVTSEGSAAYHDFLSSLRASGLGFRVLFVHAAVQGRTAEKELASALKTVVASSVDCVVLVRGGGAKTDLAAFDSLRVAEAVARSPVPVVTGLGHEIDLSIADQVAHTSTRTPTQAAELLVQRVEAAAESVAVAARRIVRQSEVRLENDRREIGRLQSGLRLATLTLQAADHRTGAVGAALGRAASSRLLVQRRRIREIGARLEVAAPRLIGRRGVEARALLERVVVEARARVRVAGIAVGAMERLCSQLSPARTLARGFSITRDARGRVVRSTAQAKPGDALVTALVDGVVKSRVEE